MITNPIDRDFEGVDLWIETNEAVFKIVQTTSLPCIPITENKPIIHDSMSNVWAEGPSIGPNRFRCDRLPKHSTLGFLLALANTDELLKATKDGRPGQQFAGDIADGIFALFGPKRKPQWVSVIATYKVTLRPHQGGIKLDADHIGSL